MPNLARIVQHLRAEEARILADLEKVRAAISTLARTANAAAPRRRTGRRFSAAQRKAVSERMRKLWAERRRKSQ
jgi:hypothetical protein